MKEKHYFICEIAGFKFYISEKIVDSEVCYIVEADLGGEKYYKVFKNKEKMFENLKKMKIKLDNKKNLK